MPPPVIAAGVAAFASIVAALISGFLAYRSARQAASEQKKLEEIRIGAQAQLEQLKSGLAEGSAEKSARRAYEFDALKRLYQEVEPLLFQLNEASSFASNRMINMARASRDGELQDWLAPGDGYYVRSTIHSLLVPLGIFQIFRQRLTFLDLSLDARIARQYVLGKALNSSFSRDHEFARNKPEIPYHPNADPPEKPDIRQGVFAGNLQRAVARMIASDGERSHVKSFGELSGEWSDPKSGAKDDLQPVIDIFIGFTPGERPVLWRILMAQLFVYRAIRQRNAELDPEGLLSSVALSDEELEKFSPGGDPAQMAAALDGGQAFLREALTRN